MRKKLLWLLMLAMLCSVVGCSATAKIDDATQEYIQDSSDAEYTDEDRGVALEGAEISEDAVFSTDIEDSEDDTDIYAIEDDSDDDLAENSVSPVSDIDALLDGAEDVVSVGCSEHAMYIELDNGNILCLPYLGIVLQQVEWMYSGLDTAESVTGSEWLDSVMDGYDYTSILDITDNLSEEVYILGKYAALFSDAVQSGDFTDYYTDACRDILYAYAHSDDDIRAELEMSEQNAIRNNINSMPWYEKLMYAEFTQPDSNDDVD